MLVNIDINRAYNENRTQQTQDIQWGQLYSQAAFAFASVLNRKSKIAIISHIKPDPDTLGAALGLYHMLGDRAKIELINDGPIPKWLGFMPGIEKIKTPDKIPADWVPDCAIALDVSNDDRLGDGRSIFNSAKCRVWIDHHPYQKDWPAANLCVIDSKAKSCSEMLVHIFNCYQKYIDAGILIPSQTAVKLKLTKDAATSLMMGLYSDSGGLTRIGPDDYHTTDALSFLQRAGGDWPGIVRNSNTRDWQQQRFIGYFMRDEKMNFENDGKLAWCALNQKEIEQFKLSGDEINGWTASLLYDMEQITGVQVSAAFIEEPGRNGNRDVIRVRLRSNRSGVPVNDMSKFFAPEFCTGGGHKAGAGAEIYNGANGMGFGQGVAEFVKVFKENADWVR